MSPENGYHLTRPWNRPDLGACSRPKPWNRPDFLSHPLISMVECHLRRIGPYRFFFYSGDGSERHHVHVQRDNMVAKFWLKPVVMQNGGGFSRPELDRIEGLVTEHAIEFMERWNEFFSA
jgi:hypothetical protein